LTGIGAIRHRGACFAISEVQDDSLTGAGIPSVRILVTTSATPRAHIFDDDAQNHIRRQSGG
jgi:hypothetical protein